jgi:Homing endonuclease associated repeat
MHFKLREKCVFFPARAPRMPRTKARSKKQIIAALRSAAHKLGRTPTSNELKFLAGISINQVRGRFRAYRIALHAAGLKPDQSGLRVETAALLEDWARIVRKVGAVPVRWEYEKAGTYSSECFDKRFRGWMKVPAAFTTAVAGGALAGDWSDVLEKIEHGPIPTKGGCKGLKKKREAARLALEAQAKSRKPATSATTQAHMMEAQTRQPVATNSINASRQQETDTANPQLLPPPLWGKKCVTATMLAIFIAEHAPAGLPWITAACFPRRPLKDRPLLGAPTGLPAFPYEPVNEMGVMVLFSMLAPQLGFVIESVQSCFPDCQAKIEVEPGRWQHFRIEFEYESLQFKKHGHDPSQCDLIVCWRHNWKNCPPNIQVLELSKIVKNLSH